MRIQAILLLAFALAGCGTTSDVMRIDAVNRPAKDPSAVQVLLDEPQVSYLSIALIKISDQGRDLSLEKLKAAMTTEAAKLGGDAVIVGTGSRSAGTVFVPIGTMAYGVESTEKLLIGKVIVFSPNEQQTDSP